MKIFENFDTGKISWFRCGGRADIFVIVDNQQELLEVLEQYKDKYNQQKGNIICIGAGSNVLFRDTGYKGLVIKLAVDFNKVVLDNNDNTKLIAGAGCLSKTISQFAIKNGLIGAEFLDTIPGSCGGLVKMNAGCFNKETKDIFYSTDILINGKIETLNLEKMNYSYRNSNIPDNAIILSATFQLQKGKPEDIENSKTMITEMQQKRKENQIVGATCGSTFKNIKTIKANRDIKVIQVWKLLDEVGLRGYKVGGAMFSEKHCNFILNTGNATANDIINLIELAKKRVKDRFGVDIKEEVKIV